MLSYLKLGAMAVAAAIISLGVGFVWGVKHHKETVAARTAADKIVILKGGKQVDEEVFNADDAALCDILGGC